MSSPIITQDQGVFQPGLDVVARGLQDATHLLDTSAHAVSGFPAVLSTSGATEGQIVTVSTNGSNDVALGVLNTDANRFVGRTPLGDVNNSRAVVEMTGRFVIRKTTYTDPNTGAETVINPWAGTYPVTTNVGASVNVDAVADTALTGAGGPNVLKWTLAAGIGGPAGIIMNVSDADASGNGAEVEIYLNGSNAVL